MTLDELAKELARIARENGDAIDKKVIIKTGQRIPDRARIELERPGPPLEGWVRLRFNDRTQ